MASQGQALQDQQSAMMATMQQQLQAMNLSPEQQQEYLKQYEDVYGLQKQQFQQQSDLMEKSGQLSRRITRVSDQVKNSPMVTHPNTVNPRTFYT